MVCYTILPGLPKKIPSIKFKSPKSLLRFQYQDRTDLSQPTDSLITHSSFGSQTPGACAWYGGRHPDHAIPHTEVLIYIFGSYKIFKTRITEMMAVQCKFLTVAVISYFTFNICMKLTNVKPPTLDSVPIVRANSKTRSVCHQPFYGTGGGIHVISGMGGRSVCS